MKDYLRRISALTPEQRALLELKLKKQKPAQAASQLLPRERNGSDRWPLTLDQERLWFIYRLDPASAVYNINFSSRIEGPFDLDVFRQSVEEILRRHETLRTYFVEENGTPLQVVAPPFALEMPVVDLRGLSAGEREAEETRLLKERAVLPFDLTTLPLWRVLLTRVGEDAYGFHVTMHHTITDWWSLNLFPKELHLIYSAFHAGRPSPLPELPVQYADFAVWQRRWLQEDGLKKLIGYWTNQLAGAPHVLELPGDRPRPPAQTLRGAAYRFSFPDALYEQLKALSRAEEATIFMTLLAAFDIILARYSGQDDFLVGSPSANRNRPGTENLIGFFLNTLVLRAQLSDDPTAREFIHRIRRVVLDAYTHQDMPFGDLVTRLRPERDLSRMPLVQVSFVFLVAGDQSAVGDLSVQGVQGLQFTPIIFDMGLSRYDLTLGLWETPSGLSGHFEYNTDLFDEATMEQMFGHYRAVLEAMVARPDTHVFDIPLLSHEERQQLLVSWNQTDRPFDLDKSVPARFAEQAARRPDAVAVSFDGGRATYAELNGRANQLARRLRVLGVGPEVCVGLCVERSLATVVGVLGIFKSGGAYVPLDPNHPAERLVWQAQDTGMRVLLVDETVSEKGLAERFAAEGIRVLCLDAEREALGRESDAEPEWEVRPEDLAYVIYTSGSTGRPKGVAVEHRQLTNTLAGAQERFGLNAEDVMPCIAPFTFDISLMELLTPLLAGARVVLTEGRGVLDDETAGRVLGEATFMHAVPTLMRHFVAVAKRGGGDGRHTRLRGLFVGGDSVAPELIASMREAFPQARLFVCYGPTETAIMCAQTEVEPERRVEHQLVGSPMGNVRLRVYDGRTQPAPVGVVGEIYVGGRGVARGYVNRPELTAERFVEIDGERWYRTGDMGRWLRDGTVAFAGRSDGQVKVRGFRVELGEVEAALREHEGVREAVVAARAEAGGEKRLVAYVVGEEGRERPTAGELRGHLRGRLPEYMVPSAFVQLEELPLTPSGKVDRKALPDAGAAPGAEYVAPRTATEEMLAGIWGEVLGVERVGATDNFFDLGGHSMLATQLMSRVREGFGVEVPLRELFDGATVEEFGKVVDECIRAGAGTEVGAIASVGREEEGMEVSFAQQRLWFIDQLQPGSALYNLPAALQLSGRLNVPALKQTLEEITRRHEALRTTFGTRDDRPVQIIHAPAPLDLPLTDISGLAETERGQELRRLVHEHASRPFDLSAGPLMRVALVKLEEREHVVLLTMHHIIGDAWSKGVFMREVAALYEAFIEGRPSPLAELPVQYADFAVWQRRWLQGDALEAEMNYWRGQLAGAPPVLELPTDRPRPQIITHRGDDLKFTLTAELSRGLKELSRREGATLFMTVLAAWQLLLSRYSGQDDIVVGTPIAGRNRAETEPLIGVFINTLVMRTRLTPRQTFVELLRQVRDTSLGAFAHQDVPFEKLVEELQPERSLSHSPIFQVMFGIENVPAGALELPGLTLSPIEYTTKTAKFDLSLGMADDGDAVMGMFEYNRDLFDPETIERMLGHFRMLLEAVVADPTRRLSELSILTGDERRRLLAEWNETRAEYPAEVCLHELFERQAERTPDAVAVAAGGERLTYGELSRRSNRLARRLRALGAGPESRVGVMLDRNAGMLVALLGVLKAGATYVPLDPSYPSARLSFMLADSGAGVLLTQERLSKTLDAGAARVVCLDAEREPSGVEDESGPWPSASPDNLAYAIYTSGSTGRPKGVMISHRALVNLLESMRREPGFGDGDVLLAVTTLSFDIAALELYLPLLCGARVELTGREEAVDAERLKALLAASGATVMQATPATWRMLVEAGWEGDARLKVLCGGEALPRDLADELCRRSASVWNMYGPTETTVWSLVQRVEGGGGAVTIGRPIANTRAYVLDGRMEPVAEGVRGELYIGGCGLSRGYVNRPSLTAASFVPDPFGAEPGGRLYRTGDFARVRPGATIECLGRGDQQVKVRGYRIELGEIEAVLRRHEEVGDCVVVARDEGAAGARLAAYVVAPAARENLTAAQTAPLTPTTHAPEADARQLAPRLRAHLREHLPEHMVPSAFVMLDELPLTPNGKVNRRALPAPGVVRGGAEYVAPRTAVEEVLCGIWGELLKAERVGVHDDFFDLGGHSLLATQLISRVREAFKAEVPLRALFEQPTVSGFAIAVEAARRVGRGAAAPPLVPVPRDEPLPLSFAQQRLWFIDQLQPGSPLYNIPVALRLKGPLNVAALARTLEEIVRRHVVLRTVFAVEDAVPVQTIQPAGAVTLPLIDLSGAEEEERETLARRLVAEEAWRAFDLAAGPLWRAVLFKLGDDEHMVLLTMHHIVSDAWSLGVLLREVAALYEAFAAGRPSPLAELAVQYADFAAWQRGWLRGAVLEEEVGYWREQLAGAPAVLDMPTDRPRPSVPSFRGDAFRFRIPPTLAGGLKALSRDNGTTLFMTLLAAWQVLLSRYSGQEDICVGTPIAGRTRVETEPLIGFFVNTLVMRARLTPRTSFRELLRQVREVTLGAYAHQDVPFEKLVEELQPERSLSHTPLFQVMFTLQNAPSAELRLPSLTLSPVNGDDARSVNFELNLMLTEDTGGIGGMLVYHADLFDAETIERMAGHYVRLLGAVVGEPDEAVGQLGLLGEAEERELARWNTTGRDYAAGPASVVELFERQAAICGDAQALKGARGGMSYAELNRGANRLARHLRSLGVGPEARVGVLLEHGPEAVLALLGVFKAGGCYVPLDAQHPAARLQFMLDDAGVEVLLTRRSLMEEVTRRGDGRGIGGRTAGAAGVVFLDDEETARHGGENLSLKTDSEQLAYVIYTSGSTGRPKGIMVEHRHLAATLKAAQQTFAFVPDDVAVSLAPFTFDISLFEVLCPLLAGARVLMVGAREALDEPVARRILGQATFMHAVPALMRQFVELARRRESDGAHTSLRKLFVGGDAVPPELVREMGRAFPPAEVFVGYGPTEAAIMCANYAVGRGESLSHRMMGRAMANVTLDVLDAGARPAPVGVVGEIYIGGAGVARGYLGRAALTAERFVPDPLGREPGGRVYRSGDMGRRLRDGSIAFAGRGDEQVKVRGYRVESGEVEAALVRHAGVKQAVVVARADASGEKRLVAYYVPAEGASAPAAAELREHAGRLLPEYMVPSAFVPLAEMPLTPLAKVDRKALPEPEGVGADAGREYVGPRTAVEEVLCGLWGELLKAERVGVHDNFFDLSGHSLLATQLISRVREAFQAEVPLRALFEQPTVSGFAISVEAARGAGQGAAAPLVPVPRDEPLPLSFAQQRLWFIDQLLPGSALYNALNPVRMSGRLDVSALEQTLSEIVRRHEALRTRFVATDGEPVQVINPPEPVRLTVIDLGELGEEERERRAKELALEEARRPFDLSRGPLLRASLIRLAEEDHVALLTVHHIVSDGWSVGVLMRELGALYEAYLTGAGSPLPELEVQYGDFAAWQRGWLRGEVLGRELDYWKRQLAGAPAVLELPLDHPRPAVQTHEGGRAEIKLTEELTRSLRELSRREGVTLFMTLLAGWQVLLSRYSGQEDICVGTTIAGRNRAEIEPLIGFFVNTLVLRTKLDGDPTVREFMQHVREVCLGAYAHQDVPFEKLVEELQPERSLSHSPFFQVMFGLENVPAGGLHLPGLSLSPVGYDTMTTKFDLALGMGEAGDAVVGVLEYNRDLFEAETIARLLRHYRAVLEALAADPTRRLSELSILTGDERRLLLAEWNETRAEYPSEVCLHELFERQAARTPERVAVAFDGRRLSYAELDGRANQVAHHLRELGVGPEVRVGVSTERSVELLVGLLGTLKAGGVYVPLDPSYPAERLAFMIEEAGVSVILTQERLAGRLPAGATRVVCLDAEWEAIAQRCACKPGGGATADNLAYIIFTSGSTGRPKGVMIEHRGGCNLATAQASAFNVRAESNVLQFASSAFDASISEIFMALTTGATLTLGGGDEFFSGPALTALLKRQAITTVTLPPAVLSVLPREELPALETIIAAGERCPAEVVARWSEGRSFFNAYGPTETTVCASLYRCEGGDGGEPPIGKPMANVEIYLLDGALQPVPVGARGELYIGGAGVGRGYANRPDLTAERFVPHPFGREAGARLYRTGDLARYRPDGNIEFLGRVDHQVKVRGFRIEPGEIEAALEKHAAVREAVVLARAQPGGGHRLVGYVVAERPEPATSGELRRHLAGLLPEYMVPGSFVLLEALPLSPNGKVDRKALPAPEGAAEAGREYVAPRTAIEEVLCGLWAELLKAERVGVHDNFFDLGGHSLLATQLVSRVRDAFQAEVPLRALFEQPTVSGFAISVEQALRAGGSSAPPLVPVRRDGALPLSFAQQRLWFIDQLQPGTSMYNMPSAVRLTGRLDAGALERTLTEIVRRHEALRTRFVVEGGEPVQVIDPPRPVELAVTDLSELGEEERERRARELALAEAARPFDLSRGPLLRASLLRLAEEEHVALLTAHHIVSDGWSTGVLIREVAALYEAFTEGRPSPLAELPVQYADFAAWQRGWLTGEVLDAEVGYWRGRLAGAPAVLELPLDRPRPVVQTHRGAVHPFTLPAELSRSLNELSRREGATLFMTLLAAWQVLLSRYTGQEDICVGTPIANRNRAETEGLIGFFVNTLVLRTKVASGATFRELLGEVREVCLGAYAHQDVPFEKLVEELQPQRSLSHSPLFQVFFALQNAPASELRLPGLAFRPAAFQEAREPALFDLSASMMEMGGEILGRLTYNTDLFDEATVERMAGHYLRLLEAMVAEPDGSFKRVGLLSRSEEEESARWNATARDYAACGSVTEMFERQASASAEAAAVKDGREVLSYGELNSRANRLAHHLRSLGVGPEVRVGVGLERSAEMLVALLAVFKAGGVYVPLDVNFPPERLGFMIEDAGVEVLVTRRRWTERMPGHAPQLVCVDTDGEEVARRGEHNPGRRTEAGQLAYVIYTSGSSGEPKGVGVEHAQLRNTMLAAQDIYGFRVGDTVPCIAPFNFDISLFESLNVLLFGGCVLLLDGREVLEESVAPGVLDEATFLHTTPGLMWQFVELARRREDGYTHVRRVCVGGDAVPPELVREMGRAFPSAEVFVGYGPTEAAIMCANFAAPRGRAVEHQMVGRAMANVTLDVLDAGARPAPIGVVGEIYIGGAGVARGYLGRPSLTAERFVPDPLGREPGGRVYRSGDMGRRLRDGSIAFAGRGDEQVKVRGYRVESGEVEAALARHAGVRSCAVVAVGEGAARRLVAYVAGDGAAGAAELRRHLAGLLPEYMVPGSFVLLEELPLSPNGKVDRKALPAPEDMGGEREYVAPRSAVEEVLAGIWGEVLGVGRVGVGDNFFELGGHSLLATQLVSRVRDALSVEVALRELFERPTLDKFAQVVEEALRRGAGVSAPPLVPVTREQAVPLSFAQQRLWFIDQLQPGTTLYNMPFTVRLSGDLNLAALEATLSEVVRRHEVLRTTFEVVDGQPVQVIHPPAKLLPSLTDLSGLPEEQRQKRARQLAGDEANRKFDLSTGPLVRASLFKMGEGEHIILFTMHHIVSDGWSMGVLLREVAALYGAYASGGGTPLAELAVQYADFAVWQRGWLRGEVLERELDYWRRQLAGAPAVLELPLDHPRPAVQTHRGALHPFTLPAELSRGLDELSRKEGVTLFMTLLAAWQALLSRYSRQEDICVGTPIANRNRAETEPLIGFFVNTLVLRTDLSGDPSFGELLQRVREVCLGAYAHQDVPFEKLVEELQPERSLSHSPLFQVMFALQNAPTGKLELPGLTLSPFTGEGQSTSEQFDLTLSMQESDGGLGGQISYNADLFEPATVARLAAHFEHLLEGIVRHPEQPVTLLPLMKGAEQRQLLVEWNETRSVYPADVCIHELFEAQAARTPDAVAVVSEETRLTYRELNARADRVAGYLRGLGVTAESLVAIMMERGTEMVVALLGVLKAGGAYVPLDPEYPAARLAFMLDDSAARVLLTQKHLADRLPEHKARVVFLDAEWEDLSREHAAARPAVSAQNAAYVIYTSGSTGTPKGVVVSHSALLNQMFWMRDALPLRHGDTMLQHTPFSFDPSLGEFFAPLLAGARLVMARPGGHRDPSYLVNILAAEKVTALMLVPSLLKMLVAEPGLEACDTLRWIICGGELLPTKLRGRLYERLPRVRLYNLYGPTEATIGVSISHPRAESGGAFVPIGRPIANTQLFLLDRHLNPVPVGAPGELYIGGDSLARAYFGRPALTAERFIPHPFGEGAGARLYRTGDLARYLPDGNVEFLGRLDGQVKLRGFRIELGEIEAALNAHAAVRESAVIVRRGSDDGEERLAAYVVPAARGESPSAGELRDYLSERLPEYMVPAVFSTLDQMPLTPSGKVDRRALPEPEQSAGPRETFTAPRDLIELQLAQIWEEVLGVETVGVRDSFFDLGGHSILATRLMSRVEHVFGRKLPLTTLFKSPTVEHLASLLRREELNEGRFSTLVEIQPGAQSRRPLFCVHPSGGNVLCYAELARQLGEEQPLYALQARGLDKTQTPQTSIEEMAAAYVEQLRTAQPDGPYLLAGWSMGGVIAYEMARQLQARGGEVERLFLLDAPAPNPRRKMDSLLRPLANALPLFDQKDPLGLLNAFGRELSLDLEYVPVDRQRLENLKPDEQLTLLLETAKESALLPPGLDEEHVRHLFKLFKANVESLNNYTAPALDGRATLFVADERFLKSIDNPVPGWQKLVGKGLEFDTVPGDHYTMLRKPNVRTLATKLGAYLDANGGNGRKATL